RSPHAVTAATEVRAEEPLALGARRPAVVAGAGVLTGSRCREGASLPKTRIVHLAPLCARGALELVASRRLAGRHGLQAFLADSCLSRLAAGWRAGCRESSSPGPLDLVRALGADRSSGSHVSPMSVGMEDAHRDGDQSVRGLSAPTRRASS